MYFGNELVYENMLASGTVLFEGDTNISLGDKTNYKNNYIKLEKVNSDWNNLEGFVIEFYLGSSVHKESVKSEDLKNHVSIGVNSGLELGNWNENSNILYFVSGYMNDCHIIKITAL